jgi:3D (Asp-Asp-Asp) domain-containing protein
LPWLRLSSSSDNHSKSDRMTATLTAYCACAICCTSADKLTAAGTIPRQGITIAAPRRVPLGTVVTIKVPGWGVIRRRVEDRTRRDIDGWDMFMDDHRQAQKFGKKKVRITR